MAPTQKSLSFSVPELHKRGIDGSAFAQWWKKLTQSNPPVPSYELELSTLSRLTGKSGSAPQLPELDLGPVFDVGAFHQTQKRELRDSQPHGSSHFLPLFRLI